MNAERKQFPQGEFLKQFNATGRIDRKNAASEFNERRDPYIQKSLREQRMQELSRTLEDTQSLPKDTRLTPNDTIPILENAAEQGRLYKIRQIEDHFNPTVSPEKKQAATELRNTLNHRAKRIQQSTKNLNDTFAKIPEDEKESFMKKVVEKSDEELNKMDDEGKTEEAIELLDDQEGMLRLYNEKAKQLLEERNAKIPQEGQGNGKKEIAELPVQKEKTLPVELAPKMEKEVVPNANTEPEASAPAKSNPEVKKAVPVAEKLKPQELSPEKKKAIEDLIDKKLKEKTLGARIKRGFKAIVKGLKSAWKNQTVRKVALVGLGVAGTLATVGALQYFGYLLPIPINHVFTSDGIKYMLR